MNSLFVGVAGPSCSGKTTFVKEFLRRFEEGEVEIIHADDYWDREFNPPLVRGYKNFELPQNIKFDLLRDHLVKLKGGSSVEVPFEVFQNEGGTKIAIPRKIILVEGFLLFYKKVVRDLFDIKVYLSLDEKEIIERRLKRNRSGKERGEYYREIVVKEYNRYGKPGQDYSDLILDGLDSVSRNVDLVMAKIANFKSPSE